MQTDTTLLAHNSWHCWLLPFASFHTPCCTLLLVTEAWRNNAGSVCTALPAFLGPRKCITHGLQSLMGCILPTMHCMSQHSSFRFHYKNCCRISESLNLVSLYLRKIFSLACFSCETLKRQAFLFSSFSFFFSCVRQKGLMVPGVPSGDRGNWE